MLKLGNQGVAAMYLGGRKITKAYLGEALVFGASAPPEPVRYTVTLSVDPQGGGTASGGGSVEAGAQVTVTASASSGYTFSGWRENGGIVSTSASYTFTVTGDRSLTAVFAAVIPTYRVTAGIDPEGSGTASGAGTYQQGTSVTVTAAPGEGYRFVKWTENGQTVSESQSYTFTVTGDRTLTAVFEAEKTSRLPAGYTEMEWIQANSNSSYINLEKALNSRSTLIIKFKIPETSGFYAINYTSYAIYGNKFQILKMANSTSLLMRWYSSSSTTSNSAYTLSSKVSSTDLGKEFTIEISDKTIFINGSGQTLSSYSLNSTSLMIGSSVSSATIRVKFQYMKGTHTSSTSAMYNFELIPCINPSRTVGVYDLTNNKFIGPTAGTFLAGPAV